MAYFDPSLQRSSPVRPRPSNAQKRGFSQKSAADILREPLNSGGFETSPLGLPMRLFRFLGEGAAEGAQIVGEGLSQPTERSAEDRQRIAQTSAGGFLGRGLMGAAGSLAGVEPRTPEQEKGEVYGPDPITPEQREMAGLTAADESITAIEDLEAERANIPPEQRRAIDQLIEEKKAELAAINQQITTANLRGSEQQQLFNEITQQTFPEGLIPGASPEATRQLNELLDRAVEGGTGGTATQVDAIIDSIMESNLPEDEKLERLGLITDQAAMRSELQTTINQLTTDRQNVQKILDSPESELLGDPSLFGQGQMNVDVQYDTIGRKSVALVEETEGILEEVYGEVIPPEVLDDFTNAEGSGILDLVATGQIDPNTDQFAVLMAQVAPDVDVNRMQSAITQGLQIAQIREEAFGTSLDQNQYEAGSMQTIYALFQAALGAGFDPETAGQIAEDRNIHKIIETNGGMVGVEANGRSGIGMLTDEAYERIGLPADKVIGDPAGELEALILYMMEQGGNPAVRMTTFLETGVWGD